MVPDSINVRGHCCYLLWWVVGCDVGSQPPETQPEQREREVHPCSAPRDLQAPQQPWAGLQVPPNGAGHSLLNR